MFIDCTAFGKQAEVINQYCQKGRPLLVEGRLKLDSWDDKQTGQKRSKHKVTIENFQFVGGREQGQGSSGGGYSAAGGEEQPSYEQRPPNRAPARGGAPPQRTAAPQAPQPPPPEQPFGEEQQFKEDDIPF